MTQTVLVTGADRGLGFSLCAGLLRLGWRVFAGQYMPDWPDLDALARQYPDHLTCVSLDVGSDDSVRAASKAVAAASASLDMLISNAGITTPSSHRAMREGQNYGDMLRILNVNALGGLRVIEAFLPLLEGGAFKRLCFISSEAGCISRSKRTGTFGYCMSKAALNMAVKNLHNELYPEGYTFRLYYPGWIRSYMSGVKSDRGDMEPDEAAEKALPILLDSRADESQLVMVDYLNRDWPW